VKKRKEEEEGRKEGNNGLLHQGGEIVCSTFVMVGVFYSRRRGGKVLLNSDYCVWYDIEHKGFIFKIVTVQ